MIEELGKKEAVPVLKQPLGGDSSDSASEHDSPTCKKLSPAPRREVERFVKKWKTYIDDPELLDPPLRTIMQFVKRMAEEEGLICE